MLLSLSLLLFQTLAFTQECWQSPVLPNTVDVHFTLSNTIINGNTNVKGIGVIKNSVIFNNWNELKFSNNLAVQPVLNFDNGKVYIEPHSTISLNQVNMNGGDTIFVNGVLSISSLSSNNSTPAKRNVIFLSSTTQFVLIGNVIYSGLPGSNIYTGNAGSTNEVEIRRCTGNILPITFVYFSVKGLEKAIYMVNLKYKAQQNIKEFRIKFSRDGKKFETINRFLPSKTTDGEYNINIDLLR